MRKHGIDLEDGDGSQTKRLNRKDLDALMGGDGRSGIFTWREKNRRKVRMIVVGYSPIFSSQPFHAPVSWRIPCKQNLRLQWWAGACLLTNRQLWNEFVQ